MLQGFFSRFMGLKKGPCDHLGQVDFVARQVTCYSHLPNIQIPIQSRQRPPENQLRMWLPLCCKYSPLSITQTFKGN